MWASRLNSRDYYTKQQRQHKENQRENMQGNYNYTAYQKKKPFCFKAIISEIKKIFPTPFPKKEPFG